MKDDAAYDLILLDLNMPSMTGVKTLCKMCEIDQDVPAYMLTAFDKYPAFKLY